MAIFLDGTTPGVPALDVVVSRCFPFVPQVVTLDGWRRRARSSGGYNGRAKGVSHHHDAGGPGSDGLAAAMYETFTAAAKPITNLHLARTAVVYVCAGGATNTIGAGGPMGDFALNQGNAWQIGIEAGNNGLGEIWNSKQVRAYIEVSAQLWIAYHEAFGWDLPANNPDQFFDHRRWAPGRKIDRKGQAICEFNGREVVFARGYSYWDTELYYEVVTERIEQLIQPPQPPTPPPVVIPTTYDTYPPGSEKYVIPIDYGVAGTDQWWTEMAITPMGLQWSAPVESGGNENNAKIRQIIVATNPPRAPRLVNDADVVNLMATIGTRGPCPKPWFELNTTLRDAWARYLLPGV